MVQAWVGHFLTPLKYMYHKYDWRVVTSQKTHKKHKQHDKHITMVVEPLAPPAAWIWWTHAAWGVGGLAHDRSDASVEVIQ